VAPGAHRERLDDQRVDVAGRLSVDFDDDVPRSQTACSAAPPEVTACTKSPAEPPVRHASSSEIVWTCMPKLGSGTLPSAMSSSAMR
jgi:hypothetical protein